MAALRSTRTRCCAAYRELELDGLTEGRRGVGTFVAATTSSLPPDGVQGTALGAREVGRARTRRRPRRRQHRGALLRDGAADRDDEGRMTAAIEHERPRQALRHEVGALGLHARDPGRLGDRARRPERRRQDDAPPPRGRPERADRRSRARPRRGAAVTCSPGSASSRRIIRCTGASRSATRSSSAAGSTRPGTARRRAGASSGSDCRSTRRSASSRAASSRRSRSRSHSRSGPSC